MHGLTVSFLQWLSPSLHSYSPEPYTSLSALSTYKHITHTHTHTLGSSLPTTLCLRSVLDLILLVGGALAVATSSSTLQLVTNHTVHIQLLTHTVFKVMITLKCPASHSVCEHYLCMTCCMAVSALYLFDPLTPSKHCLQDIYTTWTYTHSNRIHTPRQTSWRY